MAITDVNLIDLFIIANIQAIWTRHISQATWIAYPRGSITISDV